MAKINKNIAQFGMPAGMNRAEAGPLDLSSVYYSYEEMEAYATSGKVAYVGQILSLVLENENKVEVYSIQDLNGTLEKVGTSPVGDESTITVDEATGTVSLYGVPGLSWKTENEEGEEVDVTTYQPLLTKGANGVKLSWIIPSATTVEGLAAEIEGLKTTVGNHTTAIAGLVAKVDTGDKTVSAYVADEVAKAQVAAMEFMGAVSELPTGLTQADKGHFYKVTNDIVTKNQYLNIQETISDAQFEKRYYFNEDAPLSGKIDVKHQIGYVGALSYSLLCIGKDASDPESVNSEVTLDLVGNLTTTGFSAEYNAADSGMYQIERVIGIYVNNNPSFGDESAYTIEDVYVYETTPSDISVIKAGDSIVWSGFAWYVIPSGDDIEDTWRTITKTYINEEEEITETVSNRATLDIKPGLAIFDLTDTKATLDLTALKVKDVDPSATADSTKANEYITGIFVEEGIVKATKSTVIIPELALGEATAPTAADGEIVVIKELDVDDHTITPVFGTAATKNYVDTQVEGTAITVSGTKNNATDDKGVVIVSSVAKSDAGNREINVEYTEVATKAYVKAVETKIDNFAIPAATVSTLGLVKASTADNEINVSETGIMSLNMVTTDKLKNGSATFILDGGSATRYIG